ncbi:MAG: glycoside hydrolase family 31 protein [Sulfuricurvum sp.]|nr:glycoside hydrolase family 31 protein [Sulfuricurvum sp.]
MKKWILSILICFISALIIKAQDTSKELRISIEKGESVWAGVVMDGHLMPLHEKYSMDFYANNKSNQIQPVVLTNKGQFVWSEEPFKFEITANEIIITKNLGKIISGKQGTTLKEVRNFVSQKYFPASGKMPDELLFSAPQYNTWIELNYDQSQARILKYAKAIVDNGFPPGVIMIDDTWQEDYGLWDFHPRRFPNPKEMVHQLHQMGFKVMLWVCPFVSPDQTLIYNSLKKDKALLLEKNKSTDIWKTTDDPIMIRWWDGVSAELDFSNPVAVKWFNNQLDRLVNDYGVDGFKFDAADTRFYPAYSLSMGNVIPNTQTELYAQFGLRFPLNEYRACWKMGGQALVQRLHDKAHSWSDLQKLIPSMIIEGLVGYTFSCPDMIGGGLLSGFEDESKINQDLVVRSAQCHALMPMMQFSVAPWRVLDKEHLAAVKKAVEYRQKFVPLILKLAKESAISGESILKSLEYVFPDQGFANTIDQFMLGDDILVAPMLNSGDTRDVKLPKGTWIDDLGVKYKGGSTIKINVPINRLAYFIRKK